MTKPQHFTRVMKTRRENLRRLAEKHGRETLAEKLGWSSRSYLSQLIGPNPRRPITEKSARQWERALKLKSGWLDVVQEGGKT